MMCGVLCRRDPVKSGRVISRGKWRCCGYTGHCQVKVRRRHHAGGTCSEVGAAVDEGSVQGATDGVRATVDCDHRLSMQRNASLRPYQPVDNSSPQAGSRKWTGDPSG